MGLRAFLCPVIGTGSSGTPPAILPDPYRPKVHGLATYSAIIPSNVDGTPQFAWCVALAKSADWTLADQDAELERLFGVDLPDTIDTFPELRAFLQAKTVGDIPPLRRQALNDRLIAHGIDTSQVTLATTWWQVLRGIYRHLLGTVPAGDGLTV